MVILYIYRSVPPYFAMLINVSYHTPLVFAMLNHAFNMLYYTLLCFVWVFGDMYRKRDRWKVAERII